MTKWLVSCIEPHVTHPTDCVAWRLYADHPRPLYARFERRTVEELPQCSIEWQETPFNAGVGHRPCFLPKQGMRPFDVLPQETTEQRAERCLIPNAGAMMAADPWLEGSTWPLYARAPIVQVYGRERILFKSDCISCQLEYWWPTLV